MKVKSNIKIIVILILFIFLIINIYTVSSLKINNNDVYSISNKYKINHFLNDYMSRRDLIIINKNNLLPNLKINYNIGQSVKQTKNNGYIITGYSGEVNFDDPNSISKQKTIIIKNNEQGENEWNKTINFFDTNIGYSVQETNDSGFIIGGSTILSSTSYAFLLKTDSQGNEKWIKTYTGLEFAQGTAAKQTIDNGYIITGSTSTISNKNISYVFLQKTDEEGNIIWFKSYKYNNNSIAYSIDQTVDLGFIISGYTGSVNINGFNVDINYDVLLIKTDEYGNEEWNKTFDYMDMSSGYSVQQTLDKGYIVTGTTISIDDFTRSAILIKLDENGILEWDKIFPDKDGSFVQQTVDEGFIICGTAISGYTSKAFLLKTDKLGNENWTKTYKGYKIAIGTSVQQTNDKGYILTGATTKSIYLVDICTLIIKTDENGNVEWSNNFNKKTEIEKNKQYVRKEITWNNTINNLLKKKLTKLINFN